MRASVIVCIIALAGCSQGLETAWRVTGGVRSAGNVVQSELFKQCNAQHEKCIAGLQKDNPDDRARYRSCIRFCYGAVTSWNNFAQPAINSSIRATVQGLQIAEKSGASGYDWKRDIKPAVCTLLKALKDWKHLLAAKSSAVLTLLNVAKGFVCDE